MKNIIFNGTIGRVVSGETVNYNENSENFLKDIDLSGLATELGELRQAMRNIASEPEHEIALTNIAEAEQAAKNKDTSKVMEYLKSAGNWALGVATKIGVSIAADALKNALLVS